MMRSPQPVPQPRPFAAAGTATGRRAVTGIVRAAGIWGALVALAAVYSALV